MGVGTGVATGARAPPLFELWYLQFRMRSNPASLQWLWVNVPQLLPNLFHSTYSSFFHRETHDSGLDRAKMGVVWYKVGVVVKFSRALRAQLDIGPTQSSTSSYAYGTYVSSSYGKQLGYIGWHTLPDIMDLLATSVSINLWQSDMWLGGPL